MKLFSLLSFFVVCLGFASVGSARTDFDNRPLSELSSGSLFTVRQDIFIDRGSSATMLMNSQTDVFSGCFLQSFNTRVNDRVVREGRELRLRFVTIEPNFIVLSVDDGRLPHQLAQIGCNLVTSGWMPTFGELQFALDSSFMMNLIAPPLEEALVGTR